MKYLLILLLVSCSGAGPVISGSIGDVVKSKVHQSNSYDGVLQKSINVIHIEPKGEFPISRIRRMHRRYDFSVSLRFNQDCYELGDTCVGMDTYKNIEGKKFYTFRKRNSVIKKNVFISYLKTKRGWVLADEAFISKASPKTEKTLVP